MTATSKGTKFAIIFGAIGVAVGIGATLAFIQTREGDEIQQHLVGDSLISGDEGYAKLKGVVRPAIYHESMLAPGEEGIFYADASGGNKPYQFEWKFDDSFTSTLENVTHSFNSAGEYNVQLTAIDSSGIKGVISITQEVASR
jgi:PKD domain-containing protein